MLHQPQLSSGPLGKLPVLPMASPTLAVRVLLRDGGGTEFDGDKVSQKVEEAAAATAAIFKIFKIF